ncbi:MAG TPA: hypothetical protein VNE58_05675 [Casimicrobiaceae bacterium]|nr:hypothetical protein [Casimicrobiaceae bacterium]
MSTLDAALLVLIVHGALGAVDTFYAHEWRAKLPQQPWARRELTLHSLRSFLYAWIFIGLAWFEWHGAFAALLLLLFAVEYLVTLVDAVVEDRTRELSHVERVVHMMLGLTTGAYVGLIAYYAASEWFGRPSVLQPTGHGLASIVLSVYAAAVILSGLRDGLAARRLATVSGSRA